jgi:iron complex outermembrane recepter protein
MRYTPGAMLLRFHKQALGTAILLGASLGQNALAQSSATDAIEEDLTEVVVSATRVRGVGIVGEQTAPKSRVTLTSEYLDSQNSGQTVFQSLNQIPGVNFTNSDPYGASGGNLRIRGFDGSRVSVTFDGIPLNDSGNYALYPNQMLDPELIERVDVNLGTTDVDSPTASATGGTVAYKTRRPAAEFGGFGVMSYGENNFRRGLVRIDTGEFGPWNTKAFVAASYQDYDKFKGPGGLERKQLNFMVRQDFDSGNFVSLGGHWNENRNAFYRTASMALFNTYGRDYENLPLCTRDLATAGAIDNENATIVPNQPNGGILAADNLANPSSCTNYYGVRLNPSDTGNFRMQSLWHLGDSVRLSFDASWQYTLANGGGTSTIGETPAATSPDKRVLGNTNLAGFDLNGDGDILDTVRFYSPNNTNTKRWGATTSLIWDLNEDNMLRFAYSWDRARHRQTAQWGYINDEGTGVENVFAGRQGERVYAADGDIIRGRDRFSIAELKQYALEYRTEFAEDKFIAAIGVRAPFFTRELNQYCYTPNGGSGSSGTIGAAGGTLCTNRFPLTTLPNGNVTFAPPANAMTAAVQFIPPYSEEVEFDDILPNAGITFKPWANHSFYASYAEGLSAPRTDNLYSVIRLADGSVGRPTPESETTRAYDLGWRLNTGQTIASIALYRIDYQNRIVSSFDSDLGFSVDRNVGDVSVQGFDVQFGQRFGDLIDLSVSVAYNDSELLENVPTATVPIETEGMTLVETPKWMFGARMDVKATEDLRFGLQVKKVDDRYGTDLNTEVAPGYTVVDLDARYSFNFPGLESAEVRLNVINLLDEEYYGNISSGTGVGTSVGFYSIGAPRTVMGSIRFNF